MKGRANLVLVERTHREILLDPPPPVSDEQGRLLRSLFGDIRPLRRHRKAA